MRVLIKNTEILDQRSKYHKKSMDILVENGVIKAIQDRIEQIDDAILISSPNLKTSPGWIDMFTNIGEPGEEHKETIATGLATAAAGGYTQIGMLPNTLPSISSKAQIDFLLRQSHGCTTQLLPIGSITQNIDGIHLAEMLDMYQAGAIAFSDGLKPVQDDSLMMKSLQFSKIPDCVIIQVPFLKGLSPDGLMHEGENSVKFGMAGIPNIAEIIAINRDCELAIYNEAKFHLAGISSKLSIDTIKNFKSRYDKVSCSVSPFHLIFTDNDLVDYNSNFKLTTPLRTAEDQKALRDAIKSNDIDYISSFHIPVHIEGKDVEFAYAEKGMIALQIMLPMLLQAEIDVDLLPQILCLNVVRTFGLEKPIIEENSKVDLTMFDPDKTWEWNKNTNTSKSQNHVWFNTTLTGKVIGVLRDSFIHINQ